MNQRNGLHVVLGLIGVLAFLLYLLACRPSWSPDGSKILFPVADSSGIGVALADVRTGATRLLFVEGPTDEDESEEGVASVQWSRDGRQAIVVLMGSEKVTRLVLLPVGSKQPVWLVDVEELELEQVAMPFPERDGRLYLSGGALAMVDLATGRITSLGPGSGKEVALADWGAKVMYARPAPVDTARWEFGELGLDSLALAPVLQLARADLKAALAAAGLEMKGDLVLWHVSPDPHGTRVALRVSTPRGDVVAVLDRGTPPRVLKPAADGCTLGNLQWSPDGRTLYAAVLTSPAGRDTGQLCVGEFPLDGGPARLDPVAKVKRDRSSSSTDELIYQVALAPDGERIAATTTRGQPLDKHDYGLFLVDLRRAQRPVRRITVPALRLPGAR